MRALVLDGPGDPSKLAVSELQAPEPGEGQVLVRTAAAAINRSDVINVFGTPITSYPRVPGRDFAGTVVAGPEDLLGREVWGTGSGDLGFRTHGSHAELVAVPAEAVVDKPASWSLHDAGASGLAYVAAAAGFARTGVGDGDVVVVTGAAGVVGAAACALALRRGADVVGAVKDAAEQQLVRERLGGVEAVITGEGFVEALFAATGGRGITVAFDTVGNAVFPQLLAILGFGARMAAIAGVPDADVPFDLSSFYRRGISLFGVNTGLSDSAWCAGLLRELAPGFEDGSLPPAAVARTIDLGDAAEGYASTWAGDAGGRVVFRFN